MKTELKIKLSTKASTTCEFDHQVQKIQEMLQNFKTDGESVKNNAINMSFDGSSCLQLQCSSPCIHSEDSSLNSSEATNIFCSICHQYQLLANTHPFIPEENEFREDSPGVPINHEKCYFITFIIQGKRFKGLINTGAIVSIISLKTALWCRKYGWKTLLQKNCNVADNERRKTKSGLRGPVSIAGQEIQATFLIFDSLRYEALIGMDILSQLGIQISLRGKQLLPLANYKPPSESFESDPSATVGSWIPTTSTVSSKHQTSTTLPINSQALTFTMAKNSQTLTLTMPTNSQTLTSTIPINSQTLTSTIPINSQTLTSTMPINSSAITRLVQAKQSPPVILAPLTTAQEASTPFTSMIPRAQTLQTGTLRVIPRSPWELKSQGLSVPFIPIISSTPTPQMPIIGTSLPTSIQKYQSLPTMRMPITSTTTSILMPITSTIPSVLMSTPLVTPGSMISMIPGATAPLISQNWISPLIQASPAPLMTKIQAPTMAVNQASSIPLIATTLTSSNFSRIS